MLASLQHTLHTCLLQCISPKLVLLRCSFSAGVTSCAFFLAGCSTEFLQSQWVIADTGIFSTLSMWALQIHSMPCARAHLLYSRVVLPQDTFVPIHQPSHCKCYWVVQAMSTARQRGISLQQTGSLAHLSVDQSPPAPCLVLGPDGQTLALATEAN